MKNFIRKSIHLAWVLFMSTLYAAICTIIVSILSVLSMIVIANSPLIPPFTGSFECLNATTKYMALDFNNVFSGTASILIIMGALGICLLLFLLIKYLDKVIPIINRNYLSSLSLTTRQQEVTLIILNNLRFMQLVLALSSNVLASAVSFFYLHYLLCNQVVHDRKTIIYGIICSLLVVLGLSVLVHRTIAAVLFTTLFSLMVPLLIIYNRIVPSIHQLYEALK